uniref:Uncharacterized protein n=1 Tax=Pantoea phage Survivor TaxID=3232176 RepID=A0AAU8KZP3_9CAUD
MNTTTDVASSPASNELVTVLPRSFVLDGENLIVDALVVYKNGKGSPKTLDVVTPFLSGTNVRPGRVMPTVSIYDPNTGTYHFEIPVVVPTTANLGYSFDFEFTVDGVTQQARVMGLAMADSPYTLKSIGARLDAKRLTIGYEITSNHGFDIMVAAQRVACMTNLSARGNNAPEVSVKGNQVFLSWNANIDNTVDQLYLVNGALTVGTENVPYSFAMVVPAIKVEDSVVTLKGKEINISLTLSDNCEGPFDIRNLALKENGKLVKAIASAPVVIGKTVEIRLVRTVPTTNKIDYTITGEVQLVSGVNRVLGFDFALTDYVKVDLPENPEVVTEVVSHSYTNGVEKAVFKFFLNNEAKTPLPNIDGLLLAAPADLSTRNQVDYNPTTGELTVIRPTSTVSGILTTRGTIGIADFSKEMIEGEFHSSVTIESDPYRPISQGEPLFNVINYAGMDTDVAFFIPLTMANGEIPNDVRIASVLKGTNVDTSSLMGRYTYDKHTRQLGFQLPATRLGAMKAGEVYAVSMMLEIDTPTGTVTLPVHLSHLPEQKQKAMVLELESANIFDGVITVEHKVKNIPEGQGKNLRILNDAVVGVLNPTVTYVAAEEKVVITGKADPEKKITENFYAFGGVIILKNIYTLEQANCELERINIAPRSAGTPVGSRYTNGVIELSWAMRDGMGKIPKYITVNKNSWGMTPNLGNPVGAASYNSSTGVMTQAFVAVEGNVDALVSAEVKFQFPTPDANVYHVRSSFDHKKSDDALKEIKLTQTTGSVSGILGTVFFDIEIPEGISVADLKVEGFRSNSDMATDIVTYHFTDTQLYVTVALNPAKTSEHFVADFRIDVVGPNARGYCDAVIADEIQVDKFTILDGAYHRGGFVRFYGRAPHVSVDRLGHLVKRVSEDVTNYPVTIRYNEKMDLIEIDYPVKDNEFVGRGYSVEGIVDLGDVQERYDAFVKVKAIKPKFNNFILTQGGSVVDYKAGVMKVNFSIEAFGLTGIGQPDNTGIKVVAVDGAFKHDGRIDYTYDQVTGKGSYVVDIHDRSVVRHPNVELKIVISSPNVGNDYNGTLTGYSGQDNTCEVISVRTIPNKGEIVVRAGVGYGYQTVTRPVMVSFLSGFQMAEGFDSNAVPHTVSYDKNTGILEFRVKGNARPQGDVLYSGSAVLGVADAKGKTTTIPLRIHHVIRDNNASRTLDVTREDTQTFEGKSVYKLRLAYADYLYPPAYPSITHTAADAFIEYDKTTGIATVTVPGDIRSSYASCVKGAAYVGDELVNNSITGVAKPVQTRVELVDSNGPEGINQLGWTWEKGLLTFILVARKNGDKPVTVEYLETVADVTGNITGSFIDYDRASGLISVSIPRDKPKKSPESVLGQMKFNIDGTDELVKLDTGPVFPDGMTHLVSGGYNKETGRIEASWIVYDRDGHHPEKINLDTKTPWKSTSNLNFPVPTKERYNPNTGIYYAEFAPAQRLVAPRVFTGSTVLTTGKDNIGVVFSIAF